jgi:hypothetical protein
MASAEALPFGSLVHKDLEVFTPDDEAVFRQALTSRVHSSKGYDNERKWPAAICRARSVGAVQEVLRFCRQRHVKVCVRTGGHCWHASWLQGPESVLLDVGDLDDMECSESDRRLVVGPGAKGSQVLESIPASLFFPCGHCPGVSLGGFVLGGGYGLGFTRYSMTSMMVDSVEAVLASGEIVQASSDATDPTAKALMDLMRGSHACFPAVITKFHFSNLPLRPQGLLTGALIYSLADYRKAIRVALDIQFRGDHRTAAKVETTLVMKESWPDLAASTGARQCMIVSLAIWADTEEEGREIWRQYTSGCGETLVPVEVPQLVSPEEIPAMLGPNYPSGDRYEVQAHSAGPEVYDWTDDQIADMVQPVVSMWMGDECPPPVSHTLFIPIHPETQAKTHGGKQTASGFTPSITVMTYAIYKDKSLDEKYRSCLETAHARMIESPVFFTQLPEGNLLGYGPESGMLADSLESAKEKARLLDPEDLFYGFERR